MARARAHFSRLAPGPAARWRARSRCSRNSPIAITPTAATLVLEGDRPPPPEIVDKVADACGVKPEHVTFIFAPTQSLAGSVQVVARVLEVALHKAHELKFPLERIVDGIGAAPLSPPHPDFVQAMGRTNDAIIYAGLTHLFVTGPGGRRQGAGGAIAEHHLARSRPAVRRDLQGL